LFNELIVAKQNQVAKLMWKAPGL